MQRALRDNRLTKDAGGTAKGEGAFEGRMQQQQREETQQPDSRQTETGSESEAQKGQQAVGDNRNRD